MSIIRVVVGCATVMVIAVAGQYLNNKVHANDGDQIKQEGIDALEAILKEYKVGGIDPSEKDINVHLKNHFRRAAKVLSELDYIKHSANMKVRIAKAV